MSTGKEGIIQPFDSEFTVLTGALVEKGTVGL
jgi:hypothetical protein